MTDEWKIEKAKLGEKPLIWQGRFLPGELPRLAELLASDEGELDYKVSARLDGQRQANVSCIIKGFVFLTCQSTLETFRYDVAIEDRLALVENESELPPIEQETDDVDYVVADEGLDARELVEDAVILSLPMIPRKPGLEPIRVEQVNQPDLSPFAALKGLKRPK